MLHKVNALLEYLIDCSKKSICIQLFCVCVCVCVCVGGGGGGGNGGGAHASCPPSDPPL